MARRKLVSIKRPDEEYSKAFTVGPGSANEDPVTALAATTEHARPKEEHPETARRKLITKKQQHSKNVTAQIYARPLERHRPLLSEYEAAGGSGSYVVRTAGKRAAASFKLEGKYRKERKDVLSDRKWVFVSTRMVDSATLEKIRADIDPLGQMSSAALVRGQFEELFWAELDKALQQLGLGPSGA